MESRVTYSCTLSYKSRDLGCAAMGWMHPRVELGWVRLGRFFIIWWIGLDWVMVKVL